MQDQTILTAAQMRDLYLPSHSQQLYDKQNDYFEFLSSKGLSLNPKLSPCIFHLKNGLPYVGMGVKEQIRDAQVLIRISQQLILSSAKALEQPSLKEVFLDPFFINQFETWQDRVIIVYCMLLLQQKDESNAWYQMIIRFPKQCDIACFWSEEELDQFEDKTVTSAARLDLKSFTQQWQEFQKCKAKHPILQQAEFNYENYKNIFINLTNRSFGKNINYVSMVPFAELFNHHCSKVYYTVEKKIETYFRNQDQKSSDNQSSIGSYESNEYLEEGQFAYDRLQVTPYNWEVQQSYDLVEKEKSLVKESVSKIINIIDNDLNWEDFSVLFVGHIIEKAKIIEKEYLVGRKIYKKALAELEMVERSLKIYKNSAQQYYQTTKKRPYIKKLQKKQGLAKPFIYPKYCKEYQNVIIKSSKGDHIMKDNQIFFRYGRNSNRSLLLRYGFAIEGNKYEHVWVSFDIIQCLQDFPDVLEKVMDKRLSLLRKFKIHHHILNMDIIIFFRLNNWMFYHEQAVQQIFHVINIPKELAILEQIISILRDNLEKYEGNYNLTDPTLNYHQYFTAVYHIEKSTILAKQIFMLNKIIDILNQISGGEEKQKAIECLSRSQATILRCYLQNIRA